MTNFPEITDFANRAHDAIGRYTRGFTLNPEHMSRANYTLPKLDWHSIKYKYGSNEGIGLIPDDRRGIYAFVAQFPNEVFPPHGYVMYIGIAGKNSDRSLRDRYRDYTRKGILKRERIAYMLGTWQDILRFFYAPVDDDVSSESLQEIEIQLNTALMPPFSKQDLTADVRGKRRAFG